MGDIHKFREIDVSLCCIKNNLNTQQNLLKFFSTEENEGGRLPSLSPYLANG